DTRQSGAVAARETSSRALIDMASAIIPQSGRGGVWSLSLGTHGAADRGRGRNRRLPGRRSATTCAGVDRFAQGASRTQRKPVWHSPVSGLALLRAVGRYPVQ